MKEVLKKRRQAFSGQSGVPSTVGSGEWEEREGDLVFRTDRAHVLCDGDLTSAVADLTHDAFKGDMTSQTANRMHVQYDEDLTSQIMMAEVVAP